MSVEPMMAEQTLPDLPLWTVRTGKAITIDGIYKIGPATDHQDSSKLSGEQHAGPPTGPKWVHKVQHTLFANIQYAI